MATVILPSGDTADILEVDKLTAGVKLAVQRAVSMTVNNGKMVLNLAITEEMKVATIANLVTSWSKDVPVSIKAVEALGIKDYNALCEAVKEHTALLRATPDKSDAPSN
jgi:hypothetical protein